MKNTFLSLLALLIVVSACKGTNNTETYGSVSHQKIVPLTFDISTSSSETAIDSMPFQFWLQSSPIKILATNRSRGALNYTLQNAQIDIPVSQNAIQCMRQVFTTIEKGNIKETKQWSDFKKKFPYRFLEILPELKDFYSISKLVNQKAIERLTLTDPYQLTLPVLWSGLQPTIDSEQRPAGFKLKGYLKWRGVLLPDGVTCLVATSKQILSLLEQSIDCENGKLTRCNIPTETTP